MYKKIKNLFMISIIFILIIIPTVSSAKGFTLNDLIENGKELDGKTLIVKGEAIGESLNRGDYTWININDTTNAMGIYMKTTDSNKVTMYGSHKEQGDILEVMGTFNRACKKHGGDMDIHANEVEVIEKGNAKKEKISKDKVVFSIGLSSITLALGFVLYKSLNKKN